MPDEILVERWFGEITRGRIRRGMFESVPALVAAINGDLQQYNDAPRRFVRAQARGMDSRQNRAMF